MALIEPETAAEITQGHWQPSMPQEMLSEFSIDTRTLDRGSTFVGIRTGKRDGADFLDEAKAKGASSAIVERYRPESRLPQLVVENSVKALQALGRHQRLRFNGWVLGISGSFGKTSIKELIGGFFDNTVFRTEGNLNNFLGLPLSLLKLSDAIHRGAVLEVGINEPGEMKGLSHLLQPSFALLTGVGPAHLEKLETLEGVAREKAMLFDSLKAGSPVLFPADLLQYDIFRNLQHLKVHVLVEKGGQESFTQEAEKAGYQKIYYNWTEIENAGLPGELVLNLPGSSEHFRVRKLSKGMLSNFALAAAFGILRNVPTDSIQRAFDHWKPFKQRGEIITRSDQVLYLDCYNANPISMIDAVDSFQKRFPKGKKLFVLAGMNELGETAPYWHEKVAASLNFSSCDQILLVGNLAQAYRTGFLSAGIKAEQIQSVEKAEDGREIVNQFKGSIFIKGSRSYHLESIITEEVG